MNKFFHTRLFDAVFFGLLFATGIFLTMELNSLKPQPKQKFMYDKAGYYVYLPATFIYHWEARLLPKGIEKECEGFQVDSAKNKIFTKYTCGVAFLYAPFWL